MILKKCFLIRLLLATVGASAPADDTRPRRLGGGQGLLGKNDYLKDFRQSTNDESKSPTTIAATKPPTASPVSTPVPPSTNFPTVAPPDEQGIVSPTTPFSYSTVITVSGTCGTIEGLDRLRLDLCLVADASGSFEDDRPNLVAASPEIFTSITTNTLEARFGVAAFVDYSSGSDYPYRLFRSLSSSQAEWEAGIREIEVLFGDDYPESQYDAIVGAAEGLSNAFVDEPDCGWSDDPSIQRIIVLTTDATFHVPSPGLPYENDFDSTLAVLERERIRIVGLIAPGEELVGVGIELDLLAEATGGVTLPLSSDGSNIADAILGAIEALPCQVLATAVGCEPLNVVFNPGTQIVEPGGSLSIETTFSTAGDVPPGTVVRCEIVFTANGEVVASVLSEVTVTE